MSSSLSSNDNSAASDSLARASYYASNQPQQQQQQHHLLHHQHHIQPPYSSANIGGNSNPHLIHHHQSQQPQQQLNYTNRGFPNPNGSQQPLGGSHQQHQHQPLSQIFPSIYNDPSTSSTYMSGSGNSGNLNPTGSISAGSSTGIGHFSSVQRQIQQDWSNREYIEVILSNIKKITDFLNTFDLSCRSKLAILDEKLTKLEREIDFVEARVTKGETLN